MAAKIAAGFPPFLGTRPAALCASEGPAPTLLLSNPNDRESRNRDGIQGQVSRLPRRNAAERRNVYDHQTRPAGRNSQFGEEDGVEIAAQQLGRENGDSEGHRKHGHVFSLGSCRPEFGRGIATDKTAVGQITGTVVASDAPARYSCADPLAERCQEALAGAVPGR